MARIPLACRPQDEGLVLLIAARTACEAAAQADNGEWDGPHAAEARRLTGPSGLDWVWDFTTWEAASSQCEQLIADLEVGLRI